MLNMVDTDSPTFFHKEMLDQALDFIDHMRVSEQNVLVHCNQGESRAPSIALLYMACRLNALPADSLEAAEDEFKQIYPRYRPSGQSAEVLTDDFSPIFLQAAKRGLCWVDSAGDPFS